MSDICGTPIDQARRDRPEESSIKGAGVAGSWSLRRCCEFDQLFAVAVVRKLAALRPGYLALLFVVLAVVLGAFALYGLRQSQQSTLESAGG